MKQHQTVKLLAALAVAFSLGSLVVLAILATQTGEVHWSIFIGSMIIFLGAGSRLRKSRLGFN
jgi:1,4-dihydroxy-2-naphthoate octaprenyltransferase